MTFVETLLLAVALSLDACAVALASTAAGRIPDRRSAVRLSFHFGLFQFLMPVAGWAAGARLAPYISAFDHWIAFGLLAFVGVRMIRTASAHATDADAADPSRGWLMVTVAVATSIDALAIGLSLAAVRVSVWYPSVMIGLVTWGLSMMATAGGARLGRLLGARAQVAGGLILLAIGVRILVAHLW